MLTTTILRRHAAALALTGLVAVLPLSACGSGSTTADAPDVTPATTIIAAGSSADADAIWSVLRTLPAADVAALHAGFTPELRDALASIVHAVAEAGH